MPYKQCIKTNYQTAMMPKEAQIMGFCSGRMPKRLHPADQNQLGYFTRANMEALGEGGQN